MAPAPRDVLRRDRHPLEGPDHLCRRRWSAAAARLCGRDCGRLARRALPGQLCHGRWHQVSDRAPRLRRRSGRQAHAGPHDGQRRPFQLSLRISDPHRRTAGLQYEPGWLRKQERILKMTNDTATYRAVQAVAPGQLELTTKPLREPPPGYVRIRVEACGGCHSAAATVAGMFPISWPRVPGHEVVGRIDALGEGVQGWSMGQRVGIGFLAGSCGYCSACRAGDLVHCQNQQYTGVEHDGGYAEVMIAKASGLVNVPDELDSVAAAPLLCAGLTTFGALRNAPARAGDLVAIVGIGGLGHLAIQYARYMGFEVAAIGRGADKAQLATQLGAHHYVDSESVDPGEALKKLGGAMLIVNTASIASAAAPALAGMKAGGALIALGVGGEKIEMSASDLIFKNVTASGSLTGLPSTADATLRFSVLTPVAPMIETMPLERAPEAYDRMMKGDARFRIVLTMGQ